MLAFALKRLGLTLLVLVSVSIITFSLVRLAGDPAIALAGPEASTQEIEAIRLAYGFDKPLPAQYASWLGDVMRGDLGFSNILQRPVLDVVMERLPVTAKLACLSLLFAVIVAIPLGVLAAVKRNTMLDRAALSIAVVGQALPNFFFALVLILILGVKLRWLPISGDKTFLHYVMPSIALGYFAAPAIMRLTRAGMIEVLDSDYVRTARAMGLPRFRVVMKHALRNALIPVVSLTAVQLGFMLSGSIIIESVFSMNGIGRLGWQSIQRTDLEVMQALVLIIAVIYLALNYLADLVNGLLDPRLRVQ
ncbi:ABC transporter permease [Pseudooceanicola algae]|uniref:Glutathione transport system permease protein GsiC n=1 Tax=Pseudooceanicola algae TaxID=1537215 RepID=A0A418SCQ2_9RHOB|nr:ABC transporter permease [Pseudooceanicola algae]QPM92266.1 Glutathione transport system permease protein GsiC [Pseudooceanicola algae]